MGLITRCPLVGSPCPKEIKINEKTFFLAEAEKPEGERKRRIKAINEAIGDGYKIRSALEEKGINAFTCKICEMIQTCAYGMADISQKNPNVLLELGIMIALGKPTVILLKQEQTEELDLFSDLKAIEVIPFEEYLDIIDQLREVVHKLPPSVSPPNLIEDLEKIQPQLADELRKVEDQIVKEFKKVVEEAKLDILLGGEEKKEISPELTERLRSLEEKLEDMRRLGFVTDGKTAFLRGNYLQSQGKFQEALAHYSWAIELEPSHYEILNNRGNTYAKLKRYDEALADYNRSIELRPDDPDILTNRSITYIGLKRYDEALADCNRSLELRPDHPVTLASRGAAYLWLKRYDEALADCNRSLELRPDDPDTLTNRGSAYAWLKRYDEALADYNRSIELRPDDPDTLINRGSAYAWLKRYDEALADFNRSLELTPDDPDTLYNLSCLFSLWDKTGDALTYLEKAINKDKKYQENAKTDSDFDNIRNDPRFKKLVEPD